MSRSLPAAFLVVAMSWAAIPVAQAADEWTDPYTGVRLLRRTEGALRLFALEIDLCANGISLRATTQAERGRRTSSFGALVGAEAAVNGDFFGAGYRTSGFAMGNGSAWTDVSDNTAEGSLAFGLDQAEFIVPSVVITTPPSWMRELVSGRPQLVRDGTALSGFTDPTHCSNSRARTAAGFSQDRRTLLLAVVDETNGSPGITCDGMALQMASLGAWDALNFDGGGSSTMWLATGLVNTPSDSPERTVANHLAVHAEGSGVPGSCLLIREETMYTIPLAQPVESDIDGDGRTDLCAIDTDGVRCFLGTADGFGAEVAGPELDPGTDWSRPEYYTTLRMGDITGDGLADLCARQAAGFECWPSEGTGFGPPIASGALGDAVGWAVDRYYATILLADIDGNGTDDLCARAAAGFRCWPSNGAGFDASFAGPELSDASGWHDRSNFGTFRMGDVDGDGLADLCARADAGMRCYLSDGSGFPTAISGPEWSDALGWRWPAYWATIRLRDVDGDGRADLCSRTATDFRCHLSEGDRFGEPVIGAFLANDDGWGDISNAATLRLGDVDGDGALDACAHADDGVRCWLWQGDGFSEPLVGPALYAADGWQGAEYYRTFRLADVNADGRDDVCARDADGFTCLPSDGSAFGEPIRGPDWSDGLGWDGPAHYATIRLGTPPCVPGEEQCNGRDDDCDGTIDEGCPDGTGGNDGEGGAGVPGDLGVSGEDSGCGCRVPRSGHGTAQRFPWLLLALIRLRRRGPSA